jgi:excisionase family DNA binding protein
MANTLTLIQAAEMLHICPETVVNHIRHHGLPAAKLGRSYTLIDDDVIEWIRTQYLNGKKQENASCASIGVDRALLGTSTSPSMASALSEALAPQKERRRRNMPPRLRVTSGGSNGSGKPRP